MFGHDRDALIGQDGTRSSHRPAAPVAAPSTNAGPGSATQHLEFEYRDPRGRLHIVELSAMGLYDGTRPKAAEFAGTYGTLRDVTESRRTTRTGADQQKFYALFMNSPDAVFINRLSDGHLTKRTTISRG